MSRLNPIAAFFLVSAIATCSACGLFLPRKPWRTYDKMQFDSQKWRDGDRLERGRMRSEMIKRVSGKTRDQILEMLGEPDEKMSIKGNEFWIYETEHAGRQSYLRNSIDFGPDGKADFGY